MERVLTWAFDGIESNPTNAYIQVELFSGQNKYTKAGTISGPLQRAPIEAFLDEPTVRFIQQLDGVAQTGKSKLPLSPSAAVSLASYFSGEHETALYAGPVRYADREWH